MNLSISRQDTATLLAAMLVLCIATVAGCGGDDDSPASTEKIAFKEAVLVGQAPVLVGDPASGRCPDASAPCFENIKDVMSGQHQLFRVDDIGLVIHTRFNDLPADTLEAFTLQTANSFQNTQQRPDLDYGPTPGGNFGPFVTRTAAVTGRMTAEARDRYVVATWDGATLSASVAATSVGLTVLESDNPGSGLAMAAADFNGDGLDDVVLVNGARVRVLPVVAAADGTPQSFDRRGAALRLTGFDAPTAVAAGDFFGSGPMIATAAISPADPTTPRLNFYSVDPESLAITLAKSLDLRVAPGTGLMLPGTFRLAAGRFGNVQQDQLVVAVNMRLADSSQSVALITVGADAEGNPVQRATVPNFTSGLATSTLRLRSGRIDATRGLDVIALLTDSAVTLKPHVVLASFDANLNPTVEADAAIGDICIRDVQFGNFDRMQPDPTRPNQGISIRNPILQLAYVASGPDCNGQDLVVFVQSIDIDAQQPATKQYMLGPLFPVFPLPLWDNTYNLVEVHLVAYDRQGRSMVLGTPNIVTIENRAQVTVALGAPPMHVDLFDGKVFNVSAAPGGFFANFESGTDEKVTNTSSWTSTYSFAAQESLSVGYTEGNCEAGDCVNVDDKFSARQAVDGSSKQLSGSFAQQTTDLSEQTGFSDLIHYKQSALTVYIYPVLGRSVCPASKPGCADADKLPLTMMVAGPDTTIETHVDGSQIPWYQPPWMPGNILSYPGSLAQLKASAWNDPTTFASLSDPVRWQTDTSTTVTHTRWTTGGSAGTTTKLNQNYSFENDLSISGQISFGEGSVRASESLNASGSFGFERLNDTQSETSNSTGIGFTKRAGFADPALYAYWVTPHIFGQAPPPGAGGDQAPSATREMWGALRSSYVVDPLSSGAGAVWRQQYTRPDLALNHPSRWRVTSLSSDRNDGSCLVFDRATSDVQCASLADKDPSDPWTDEYHHMRGFFIGAASANGAGPQLSVATAGDQLLLQVRVHNFSFAPMPTGTTVRVRIHAMQWDTSTNRPIGKSFVAGTGTSPLGVVPPFNVDTDQPNWVLVALPFDTTPYANKDLVFGAVTWMEDGNGNLVAEIADKGLTAIPDASLDFADLATLEEKFGNNHGFYNRILHVDARQTTAAQQTVPATRPSLAITHTGVERAAVARNARTLVGARVQVGESHIKGGVTAHFYDGDPAAGGRLFGVQSLALLRAGRSYDLRVPYRSALCGQHDLYVVAGPGTRFEHAAKIETVTVSCN